MSATIIDLAARREFEQLPRVTSDAEQSAIVQLRRARLQIAQLERNLTKAMHDSLSNYNRAREAERLLDEVLNEPA